MRLYRLIMMIMLCLLLVGSVSADELEDVVDGGTDETSAVEIAPSVYIVSQDIELFSELGIDLFGSITSNYGVGTSNINIFGPVASKLPYGTHYVYWREGQYYYKLAYSDSLELNGTTFKADSVTVVTYYSYAATNSQATFTTAQESNFSLSAGNYLVWSDLGDYPQLWNRENTDYAKLACVILCSFGLFYLFRLMWTELRFRFVDG